MLLGLLILGFVLSLLPPFREFFKKELKKVYLSVGIILFLTQAILLVFVFPKIITLYEHAQFTLMTQRGWTFLAVSLLISAFLFGLGYKLPSDYKSNKRFYLLYCLLIILVYTIAEIDAYVIAGSIYVLTGNTQ